MSVCNSTISNISRSLTFTILYYRSFLIFIRLDQRALVGAHARTHQGTRTHAHARTRTHAHARTRTHAHAGAHVRARRDAHTHARARRGALTRTHAITRFSDTYPDLDPDLDQSSVLVDISLGLAIK